MFRRFIIILAFMLSCSALAENNTKVLITINKFVSHPALDNAEQGIIKAITDRGLLNDKVELQMSNAQGNIATAAQISRHQASLNPAFMVAIATPAAQSALKAKPKDSILGFTAITDPAAAGLISNDKIIGVTDAPPVEELLEITLKVMPKLESIGIIFNPSEVNSVKMVEMMKQAANKHGIRVEKAAITSSTNVKMAVKKLAGEVQLIYLPLDNLVISAIDGLVREATSDKIPLISNDPSLVDKGLLLSLGADYLRSGIELGNMIADMIDGKTIEPRIRATSIKELKINSEVAKKLNITIPKNIKL